MNPLWLIQSGGPVVGVILLLSVYGAYVFLTRLQKVRRAVSGQDQLLEYVGGGIMSGNLLEASANAASSDTPLGRVLAAGVRNMPRGPVAVQAALESSVTREETEATSGLSALATIAQVSPLLGLLGTVIGLIRAFGAVSAAGGQPTLSEVAGGISLALTSTATGLVVAITFYVAHNYLARRVEHIMAGLDRAKPTFSGWLLQSEAPHREA